MKKLIATLALTLCIFSCHAQITQVTDMEEVFHYFDDADSKTLAIFDVDMVLVQPSDPAFQMPNMKRFSATAKRIMKEVPQDKQMMFLSLMTTSSETILLDDRTPQFLQQLAQRGVPAMALTSNLTGEFTTIKNMQAWRKACLGKLGIDFSKNPPSKAALIFDDLASYRGNYSTYSDGMLFVNGTVVSKGDAFLSFLAKTKFAPTKVIFVDDREENLKSLEAAIQKLDTPIEYQGIHFTGAQNYPSKVLSEAEFEAAWQKLAALAQQVK